MNRGLIIGSGSRLGGLGAFGLRGTSGLSDTTRPSVAITSSESSPSGAATIPLTITFSENVTGFAVGDITVAGCTLSGFSGSGAVYTVTATPTAYEMTVDIAQNVCVDGTGNGNTAAVQFPMVCTSKWFLAGGIAAANCLAAYTPKGAASLADSYTNRANPGTYTAAPGSAPAWDATNGWKFETANSNYLTTGLSWLGSATSGAIARVSNIDNLSTYPSIFGCWEASVYFSIDTGPASIYYANGSQASKAPVLTSGAGILAIGGTKCYRNGVDEGLTLSDTPPTSEIYLGCRRNSAGNPALRMNGYMQGVAFYNIALSQSQVSALTTALGGL